MFEYHSFLSVKLQSKLPCLSACPVSSDKRIPAVSPCYAVCVFSNVDIIYVFRIEFVGFFFNGITKIVLKKRRQFPDQITNGVASLKTCEICWSDRHVVVYVITMRTVLCIEVTLATR